jgi:hypothetical protein
MIYPIKDQRGGIILSILFIGTVAFVSALYGNDILTYFNNKPAYEVINEKNELKKAISNLTQESQIGYAKVIDQTVRNGRMYTRLRFVETDRHDPYKKILEKEYEIEGSVVHFDSIIIKFFNQMVMDGKERSLYLWRRVYGERMNPGNGFPIETEGKEPERYADIFNKLSIDTRDRFWEKLWSLSDNPDQLRDQGIKAIFGTVVYKRLRPNLIYVFKISNSGELYPETVPDF